MIITNNETALRIPCQSVTTEECAELIQTLENELKYANRLGKGGIGLAAPQIGLGKHIAIVRMGSVKLDLINCQLQNGYDQALFQQEGCLSFPGRVEDTLRYQEIYVVNNLNYPHSFVATGLTAVVIQHELDHLNSILFMDRAAPKAEPIVIKNKLGPNEPCSCGSGVKYKRCCAKKENHG